jgi:hypothetical protein
MCIKAPHKNIEETLKALVQLSTIYTSSFSSRPFPSICPRSNDMSSRVDDSTHDGKLWANAAECPAPQKLLSPARLALRFVIVLAIGFNISGFGAVYDTLRALAKYLHGVESLSAPETPLDATIYICSGILLAAGFYLLIQRMTSTVNGAKSPIQNSKPLRYASIAVCALWVEQDGVKRAVTDVMSYVAGKGVTLSGALFAVCGEFATALQMGLIWYKLANKAFSPSKQQVVPGQMPKDTKRSEIQSV